MNNSVIVLEYLCVFTKILLVYLFVTRRVKFLLVFVCVIELYTSVLLNKSCG